MTEELSPRLLLRDNVGSDIITITSSLISFCNLSNLVSFLMLCRWFSRAFRLEAAAVTRYPGSRTYENNFIETSFRSMLSFVKNSSIKYFNWHACCGLLVPRELV